VSNVLIEYLLKTLMIKLTNLVNEAYGSTKLSADIENWANSKGLNFKKLSAKKSPGNYGASISNTFLQVGDKYVLVRYETVPGAPRLNQLRFFILDKPDLSAKVLASADYVEDFGYVQSALEKAISASGKEAENWNVKSKLDKFIRDLSKDKKYNKFSDAQAGDMAQSILDDNEGLERAIQQIYKVSDAAGWLADRL
jgi:hypothetical protein